MEQPTTPKKPRGRRPVHPDLRMVIRTMRLTPYQAAKLDAYGSEWAREQIENGKPPAGIESPLPK